MAFEELTDALNDTTKKTQSYINHTAEYHKLRLFKGTMKFTTRLANGLIIGALIALVLLFILVGAALLINQAMESAYLGFFFVGIFLAILLLLFYLLGKKQMTKMLLESFSDVLYDTESELRAPTQDPKEEIV